MKLQQSERQKQGLTKFPTMRYEIALTESRDLLFFSLLHFFIT